MVVTGSDDAFSAPHPAKGGGCFQTQFPGLGDYKVGNLMGFEMAPHIFHRVEFRGVGRQCLDEDAAPGGSDEVFDQNTAMNGCSIPQDEYLSGNMSLQVLQKGDHLGTFDAAGVDLKVEAPQGQTTYDGKTLPVEGFLQDRGLSAGCPSPGPGGARAQPALIYKDDGAPLLAGFFFRAGHSTRCQRRMAFSLRSTARRSGRWQLKPLAPNNRQT